MSHRYLKLEPSRLDPIKLAKAANTLVDGEIAVLPTDTNYVLACRLGDKRAISRIQLLRGSGSDYMTLLLADFAALGTYAEVDNYAFKLLKDIALGGYTFIFRATKEVPRAFAHKKRKSIGVRIPAHEGLRSFGKALAAPLICSSLKIRGAEASLTRLDEHGDWLAKVVDLVVDCGELDGGVTTILDMTDESQIIVEREGVGSTDVLDG